MGEEGNPRERQCQRQQGRGIGGRALLADVGRGSVARLTIWGLLVSFSTQLYVFGRVFNGVFFLYKPAQPHNSVLESSFYKHIDTDLHDPERIRQLLIWCSLRAAAAPASSSSASKLPPLSAEAVQ